MVSGLRRGDNKKEKLFTHIKQMILFGSLYYSSCWGSQNLPTGCVKLVPHSFFFFKLLLKSLRVEHTLPRGNILLYCWAVAHATKGCHFSLLPSFETLFWGEERADRPNHQALGLISPGSHGRMAWEGSALVPGSKEVILARSTPAWDHGEHDQPQEHSLEVWCIS